MRLQKHGENASNQDQAREMVKLRVKSTYCHTLRLQIAPSIINQTLCIACSSLASVVLHEETKPAVRFSRPPTSSAANVIARH